jgi:hypothetical protein
MRRLLAATAGTGLVLAGLVLPSQASSVVAAPDSRAGAQADVSVQAGQASAARKKVSSRKLLRGLSTAVERRSGYSRAKFKHWIDADRDGCDTRAEVLIGEARKRPSVGAGCSLSGGTWFSYYDSKTITSSSGLDIDHLVPLAEAWDSGARRWDAGTRTRFANDLRYGASLIAVSASTNRSKGDRDPAQWMPPNTGVHCAYAAQWTAVKTRWKLSVDRAERKALRRTLRGCGWPKVVKPPTGKVKVGSSSSGSSRTGGGSDGAGGSTTVSGTVHPGAFCSPEGAYGYTSAGTRMRCTYKAGDSRARWRAA